MNWVNHYRPIHVSRPADIPSFDHYAIITGSSITIPGDERSRTAPGHGYPEHTDYYIRYEAYDMEHEAEWKERIKELSNNVFREPFKALIVRVPEITMEINVRVSDAL